MDDLGDAAVALLSELVAIDSVNPGLVDGAAGESAIVAFLANRLRANGFTVTIVNALGRDDRPSLLAVGPGPSDAPTVVLNGHVDTVGVSGMPSPFTPRVEGHRLFARGAADMKGSVAAMVVAAERLAADHLTTAHVTTAHVTTAHLTAAHLTAERPTGSRGIRPVVALVADEEDASLGRWRTRSTPRSCRSCVRCATCPARPGRPDQVQAGSTRLRSRRVESSSGMT